MRRVSVTNLKNELSRYLRLVKRGETLEVTERSVPVALLTGLPAARSGQEALDRLVQEGIISPARRVAGTDELADAPVPCSGDVVGALVEERGDR